MERRLRLKERDKEDKGKLIVFEGTDGAGKTTLLKLTERFLEERQGREQVSSIKQPTDLSRKTRLFQKMMYSANHETIDYRAVQLLTMSDRIQHGYEVIEPMLRRGKTLLCDRYIYTSLANMLARGYKKEKWFYEAAKYILKPDIVFLAYVPPRQAIERIKSRPEEKDRYLDEELLRKVSDEFMKLSKREGFVVLDTSGAEEKAFSMVKGELYRGGVI